MSTHAADPAQESTETTVVTLVKEGDRFQAVIAPAAPEAPGTHELRYLWNQRPFISRVFQRGAFDALLASVRALQDELIGRGWRVAHEMRAHGPAWPRPAGL